MCVTATAAAAGDLKRDLRFIVPLFDLLPAAFSTGISFNCDKNNQWNIFICSIYTKVENISEILFTNFIRDALIHQMQLQKNTL